MLILPLPAAVELAQRLGKGEFLERGLASALGYGLQPQDLECITMRLKLVS